MLEIVEGDAVRDTDMPVVAKVGPEYIYARDIAKRLSEPDVWLIEKRMGADHARRLILQERIDELMLSLLAREKGFHREPDFIEEQRVVIDNWVASLYRSIELKKSLAVSDEDLRDKLPPRWIKARFGIIVVPTEQDAERAHNRILEGEDFSAVAKELSIGPNAERGGRTNDMLMMGGDYFPASVQETLFGLQPGEVSEPFKGYLGWTICQKIEDYAMTQEDKDSYLSWPRQEELERRVGEFEKALLRKLKVEIKEFDILDSADDAVAMTIDNQEMNFKQFSRYLRYITQGGDAEDILRNEVNLKERIAVTKAMALEAYSTAFHKRPTVERRLRKYLNENLTQSIKNKWVQEIELNEEELRNYFEGHIKEFQKPLMVKASHIVLDTIAEGYEVKEDIINGAPFQLTAQFRSKDKSTASKGGDLGWIPDNQELRGHPVYGAIFDLDVGEISDPIEYDGQVFLVFVEERKEAENVPFENVRENVRKAMVGSLLKEKTQGSLQEARTRYPVEINEDELMALPINDDPSGGSDPHQK